MELHATQPLLTPSFSKEAVADTSLTADGSYLEDLYKPLELELLR